MWIDKNVMSLNCVWTWTSGWRAGLEGLRRGSQVTSFWKAVVCYRPKKRIQVCTNFRTETAQIGAFVRSNTNSVGFPDFQIFRIFQSNNGSKGRLCRNSSQLHWYCALYFTKLTQPDFSMLFKTQIYMNTIKYTHETLHFSALLKFKAVSNHKAWE